MPKNESQNPILTRLKAWQGFYGKTIDSNMTELAQYCQVARSTLYNWLNGKTKPSHIKELLIQEWLDRKPQPKKFEGFA